MPKVAKEKTEQLVAMIDNTFPELSNIQKRYLSDQAYFFYKKKAKNEQTRIEVASDPNQTKI